MKYQQKPVVVNVWKLDSNSFISKTEEWVQQNYIEGNISYDNVDKHWNITTLEGIMTAYDYDYLIQGVNGEVYACKPDIFEKTYELVEEQKTYTDYEVKEEN